MPLVADCFGDDDTLALAHAHVHVHLDAKRGLHAGQLLQALPQLAAVHDPIGLVYGTGFEDRPNLLAHVAATWRLLGNPANVLAHLKNPESLAELCRECEIPHPQIAFECPVERKRWVVKRAGGAGGAHVHGPAARRARSGSYYQLRVTGMPVSALVLGNGHGAIVLGFSEQWSSPARGRPFRYGGAARPAALPNSLGLPQAIARIASHTPILGLNSFDFLIDRDASWLLEINPRPAATLDIFEPENDSLFALHVAACEGMLPRKPPKLSDAAAACIVYADRDVPSVPEITWPAWAADRQPAGTSLRSGDPFCTVLARASALAEAKSLVKERAATILALLDARLHGEE